MNRSFSVLLKGVSLGYCNKSNAIRKIAIINRLSATNNTFNLLSRKCLLNKNIAWSFSTNHQNKSHSHHHHSHPDPIKSLRQQFQTLSTQIQLKHSTQPQLVIKQLYQKCQSLVTQNKKVEIFIIFELICQFIESKNLTQQYSSFLVMSASNSFLMGKYQQVQRRCKLALPHQIKKYGNVHKNVGDIYNMLGISISKSTPNKGSEALQYLQKALTIRKQLHGVSGQAAEVLFNAGIIQQQSQKMLEKAQIHFLDAREMLQNTPTPAPLLYIKTKMRLSQVQYKIHQVPSKYISDMLRLQELINKYKTDKIFQTNETNTVQMFLSLLYRNLGKKFIETNDNANAIKYYQKCLTYLRDNKMQTQDRIQVLQSCAIAYTNVADFAKAATLLEQSQKIIATFPGVTDEYKFHLLKFLSQIYRKTAQLQKQLTVLENMRSMIKQTKQKFLKPLDNYETDVCLIYCLGNLKMFERVIEVGKQTLLVLEEQKLLPAYDINDFVSNISAYIGFAHLSKPQPDIALQYFIKSHNIFSLTQTNKIRSQFHMNILRNISSIYIQYKKDYKLGFEFLNKQRLSILNNKQIGVDRRLNDMVVLLIDYQVDTSGSGVNEREITAKLIEAGYISRINEVLNDIVQLCQQNKQNKQQLQRYYILIDSVYQMLVGFNKINQYPNKKTDLNKMRQLIISLIRLFDKVFQKQISEVVRENIVGVGNNNKMDQGLKIIIKKGLNVKRELKVI